METNSVCKLDIWQAAREYAGIAEAGGVKNVACSLAEGLVHSGAKVTVFIPYYGCIIQKRISKIQKLTSAVAEIPCGGDVFRVAFSQTRLNGVRIIFVANRIFAEKRDVYTYTQEDEDENPAHKRGTGREDEKILNVVFQKAVVAYSQLSGEVPDVMQCQDAHTALIPAFAKASPQLARAFERTRFFVTIHNAGAGYHQKFDSLQEAYALTGLPMPMLQTGLWNGQVQPFLIAAGCAKLFTVSPWYAKEICDPRDGFSDGLAAAFAQKGIAIFGITNGIDIARYSPDDTAKSLLPFAYNPAQGDLAGKAQCREWLLERLSEGGGLGAAELERFGFIRNAPRNVYFASHGRIVRQKGIEVLCGAAELVMEENPDACFIVIGQGERALEEGCKALAEKYAGRYVYIRGYERMYTRLCVAASDFLVMPSFFEPCGLEDFIAQIFGTVPVAHAAGGLNKILDGETGFLYAPNTPKALAQKLLELLSQKRQNPARFDALVQNAARHVAQNYSWGNVIARHYLPLYRDGEANDK